MDPLSLDLRKRIVAAYRAKKGTYAEIAAQFQVGEASVSRLLRRDREQGDLRPDPPGGGYPPRIPEEQYETLRSLVAKRPDQLVCEICDEWFRLFKVSVSVSSMQRTLRRAGLSRKKDLCPDRKQTSRSPRAAR
jgi:transposase